MFTSSVNVWNPPPRQALFFPALFPLSIHLTLHLWKWFHLVLVLFWVSHEHFVLFMPVCTLVNETCLGAMLSNGLWGSDTPGLSGFPLPEQGLRASCSVADPYHAAVAALLKQCQPHTWKCFCFWKIWMTATRGLGIFPGTALLIEIEVALFHICGIFSKERKYKALSQIDNASITFLRAGKISHHFSCCMDVVQAQQGCKALRSEMRFHVVALWSTNTGQNWMP